MDLTDDELQDNLELSKDDDLDFTQELDLDD